MQGEKNSTAGLRGAHWDPSRLDPAVRLEAVALQTADGAAPMGFLFAKGGERGVVCLAHPRELLVTHYLVPEIVAGGYAAFIGAPRSPGNDLRLEHETALLDVAAGMQFLRERGFREIVLLGNSGGAGLYAFYNQQALLAPERRLAASPGGRPTMLTKAVLPAPDSFIFVSPHPGQGKLLQNCIDGSVTDENDPYKSAVDLNPFGQINGFKRPPESSKYSADFITRYRAAQTARVARLDQTARDLIASRMDARRTVKEGAPGALMQAAHTPIMTIWRTDADLRAYDLSFDPSDRRYGSLWGADPLSSNFGSIGFARLCTAESWLSTWSGLSSNASFERCGASIEQPTLMIEYTGDCAAFPADQEAIFASIGAGRKRRLKIRGDHHGRVLAEGEDSGQKQAGEAIRGWLAEMGR